MTLPIMIRQVQNCHRRISSRSNKGIPPKRFAYKALITKEPTSFKKAIESVESNKWLLTMQEEINAMNCNETWDLVEQRQDRKVVGI